jgi:hypothetical protein
VGKNKTMRAVALMDKAPDLLDEVGKGRKSIDDATRELTAREKGEEVQKSRRGGSKPKSRQEGNASQVKTLTDPMQKRVNAFCDKQLSKLLTKIESSQHQAALNAIADACYALSENYEIQDNPKD